MRDIQVAEAVAWYYLEGDNTLGPIAEADLHALVLDGRLEADTLVWAETGGEWVPYITAFPAGAPQPTPAPDQFGNLGLNDSGASPSSSGPEVACSQCGSIGWKYSMKRIGGRIYCAMCSGERRDIPAVRHDAGVSDPHDELRRLEEPGRKRLMLIVAVLIIGALGYALFTPNPEKAPSQFKQMQMELGKNVGKDLYHDGQKVGRITYLQYIQPNQNMISTGPGYFSYKVLLDEPRHDLKEIFIECDAANIEIK